MNPTLFFIALAALLVAELLKGLSANGTPPVLQKYAWQLDLAHVMWSTILPIRVVLLAASMFLLWTMSPAERSSVAIGGVVLFAAWLFVFWLFNFFWVGKVKFLPLTKPTFAKRAQNKISLSAQVIGVERDGQQKAYPVSMIFYHHQIADRIADLPIWVTYCGLCRSGRVYDISIDGRALDFSLIGAITFNAVFKDNQTGSWWRQETGEAVKGPFSGKVLDDIPMEQMSLENWLAKYPDSEILQYDPAFQKKYDFITSLMNYEASLPGWHRQETPPLVIGVEFGGQARAYDWNELKKRRLVADSLSDTDLLLLSSKDGSSAFAYERALDGSTLDFEMDGDRLIDTKTQSQWNVFGKCVDGAMQGSQLTGVQIYQQFLRAWASFHPQTSFYNFEAIRK